MGLDDQIGPPESARKEPPSERYIVIVRGGELTVVEKRKYLLAQVIRKKIDAYAAKPLYVPAQNL